MPVKRKIQNETVENDVNSSNETNINNNNLQQSQKETLSNPDEENGVKSKKRRGRPTVYSQLENANLPHKGKGHKNQIKNELPSSEIKSNASESSSQITDVTLQSNGENLPKNCHFNEKNIDTSKLERSENNKKKKKTSKLRNKKLIINIEKANKIEWFKCDICENNNLSFWTQSQDKLSRHKRYHLGPMERHFQCPFPECGIKLYSLPKVLKHDRQKHNGPKDHECRICGAEVTDIAVHMKVDNTYFVMANLKCSN